MNARSLIDSQVESGIFVLDLGEDNSDFKYLEIELPRVSSWFVHGGKLAPELMMLHQALKSSAVPARIHEGISSDDKAEIRKMIRSAVEKAVKSGLKVAAKDKKERDLTIAKNVLTSFVKSLYAKRSSWIADLSVDRSS